MKHILQYILGALSRLTLWRYRPMIIGITGSVGKTSTREAIFAVLKKKYRVRTAEKNYNNEIGLPLAILGIPHCGKNVFGWFSELFCVCVHVVFFDRNFPEILVLEYGVDRPGDMEYLVSIAKPDVAVMTAIGQIPVHVEFFSGPLDVAKEKAKLIQHVPISGSVLMNADDEVLCEVKNKTKAKILTYGFDEHADAKILNYELKLQNPHKAVSLHDGISFKIEYRGNTVPIRLSGCFGKPQAYAASAASLIGILFNMNFVEIAEALAEYIPPPGRLRLIEGIKQSLILDDSYNASPHAMHEAIDVLCSLPARRRIAVLGDMLEIGKFTEHAHRAAGDSVAQCADVLITVGPRAKFTADEAGTRGIERKSRKIDKENIYQFDDSREAGKKLDELIRPGDLVLVKGSQSMHMERVCEEIMAEPLRKGELLVRQDGGWREV